MDFSFSEEQTLLRNSVSKFLADNYNFETFKKVSRTEPGWSKKNWKQFAELGLLAAPLPEAYGGLGGGPVQWAEGDHRPGQQVVEDALTDADTHDQGEGQLVDAPGHVEIREKVVIVRLLTLDPPCFPVSRNGLIREHDRGRARDGIADELALVHVHHRQPTRSLAGHAEGDRAALEDAVFDFQVPGFANHHAGHLVPFPLQLERAYTPGGVPVPGSRRIVVASSRRANEARATDHQGRYE